MGVSSDACARTACFTKGVCMKFALRTSWFLPLLVALLASATGFAGETSTPDAAALAPESAAVSPDALHAHLRDAWADQSAAGP